MAITVTTNNVPRDVIDASELSAAEREVFDYLDWPSIEEGSESASFFRYRGIIYELGGFMATSTLGTPNAFGKWDGYQSDSFFSGIVVRYVEEFERVVVGTYYVSD